MTQPDTANANDVHPFALLEQQKIQRDIRTRTANKERDRLAIQDIADGVGYSSDKYLPDILKQPAKRFGFGLKMAPCPDPIRLAKTQPVG